MIADFPDFSPLTIVQKSIVEQFTSYFEPYSDFNFTSLFAWDINGSAQLSNLNGNLVIKIPNYMSGNSVYSILGQNKIDQSLSELLSITEEITLVPGIVIEHISERHKFKISEDRDGFDYIYLLSDLAEMEGGSFRNKRKRLSDFINHSGKATEIKPINFQDNNTIARLKEVFQLWSEERPWTLKESHNEGIAIDRICSHARDLRVTGLEIMVNNQSVGFSINESLNENYCICHFQKTLLRFNGIDVYFSQKVAENLAHLGYKYFNWEQDLGLPGLRESKTSYHPIKFLRKYKAQLKG